MHGVQNAQLNRLLAVARAGQRTAFDNRQRVLQIGVFAVRGQPQLVGRSKRFTHGSLVLVRSAVLKQG